MSWIKNKILRWLDLDHRTLNYLDGQVNEALGDIDCIRDSCNTLRRQVDNHDLHLGALARILEPIATNDQIKGILISGIPEVRRIRRRRRK